MSADARLPARRVLVAIDASPHSLAALEAAAALCELVQAELLALYVEDESLLRLASLPSAHALSYPTATRRPLDVETMERELRQAESRAREAVQRAGARARVPASLRSVRGRVPAEVLSASEDADFVAMGRRSHDLPSSSRMLGGTAREVAATSTRPVLLVREGESLGEPIVLFDGSEPSSRALDVGLSLLRPGSALRVLVAGRSPDDVARSRARLERLVTSQSPRILLRTAVCAGPAEVARAVAALGQGTLVLGVGGGLLSEADLEQLVRITPSAVVVARG